MKDICIDFCESVNCQDCKYKDATVEERNSAYQELLKNYRQNINNISSGKN